jgi:hypothetical protein
LGRKVYFWARIELLCKVPQLGSYLVIAHDGTNDVTNPFHDPVLVIHITGWFMGLFKYNPQYEFNQLLASLAARRLLFYI